MNRLTIAGPPLALVLFLIVGALPTRARAHAFPLRSEPRVGWTVATAPTSVKIWFDGALESAFSTITVYNAAKQRVDKGNSHLDPSDPTILEVDLLPLPTGSYRVYWSVLSTDTHVTSGDFSFTIQARSR